MDMCWKLEIDRVFRASASCGVKRAILDDRLSGDLIGHLCTLNYTRKAAYYIEDSFYHLCVLDGTSRIFYATLTEEVVNS